MRTVTVTWEPDEDRFVAEGSNPRREITINAPGAAGSTEPPRGFSASELLLAGVGSCSAWDVVEILRKARQAVSAIDVTVEGEQAPDPPWPYTRITLRYVVQGRALRRATVERAIRLSCTRYCSAIATVRGVADVVHSVETVSDPDPAADQVTKSRDPGRQPARAV